MEGGIHGHSSPSCIFIPCSVSLWVLPASNVYLPTLNPRLPCDSPPHRDRRASNCASALNLASGLHASALAPPAVILCESTQTSLPHDRPMGQAASRSPNSQPVHRSRDPSPTAS